MCTITIFAFFHLSLSRKRKVEDEKKKVMKYMKKMSKKASSTMGYHKAYLKAEAANRNLDLEKYKDDSTSESDKKNKNVYSPNPVSCKYLSLI